MKKEHTEELRSIFMKLKKTIEVIAREHQKEIEPLRGPYEAITGYLTVTDPKKKAKPKIAKKRKGKRKYGWGKGELKRLRSCISSLGHLDIKKARQLLPDRSPGSLYDKRKELIQNRESDQDYMDRQKKKLEDKKQKKPKCVLCNQKDAGDDSEYCEECERALAKKKDMRL